MKIICKLYAHTHENLDKSEKFLVSQLNSYQMFVKYISNRKQLYISKETETITKNLPGQKTPGPNDFGILYIQICENKVDQSYKFFQIIDSM